MSSQDTTSLLPDNAPPLPPSTPPLPTSAPPPPMPQTTSSMYASMPPPTGMMPPNTMSAAAYQQYYQQYMQYMYSLYGASAQTSPAYNYNTPINKPTTSATSTTTPNNVGSTTSVPTSIALNRPTLTETKSETKSAIKINLNFKSQPSPENAINKAKRFATSTSTTQLTNIQAEQENFKKQQQEVIITSKSDEVKADESIVNTTSTQPTSPTTQPQADIVSDINKWPASLKAYCTKVYQHFQKLTNISEDQVTKYLQHRITETFKIKPDLNIAWESEKIPEVSDIKQVAPYSQAQLEQQKRNKKLHEAALAIAKAKAAELLAQKEKVKQQLVETKKANTVGLAAEISSKISKRKYETRSRSGSPSSSSTSSSSSSTSSSPSNNKSSDFIELSSSKKVKKSHAMMKIEKKKLKNIQINNVNGKKSYLVLEKASSSGKRKSNEETSDGEDEDEESDEDEEETNSQDEENTTNGTTNGLKTTSEMHQKLLTTPNKFLSKKQKKIKANLINRQKRFQETNTNNLNSNKKKFINHRNNVRTLFSSTNRVNFKITLNKFYL